VDATNRVTEATSADAATYFYDRIDDGPAADRQQTARARDQIGSGEGCRDRNRRIDRSRQGHFVIPGAAQPALAGDGRHDSAEFVDSADIPRGGQLHLIRHGTDYEILFDEEQLMGSWESGSEVALAVLGCEKLGPKGGRVLIGGLGMGFTLNAALKALPAESGVVVAELVPKVVDWAKGPLAHLFGGALDDPRVTIDMRDVHDVIVGSPEGFDAILLDVDNGPDGLIDVANERLYCNWGLRTAHAALRPGGVLAVWSAYRDGAFVERLEKAGFTVDEVEVPDEGNPARSPYTIWLASKAAG